jgi:hypothetical protein
MMNGILFRFSFFFYEFHKNAMLSWGITKFLEFLYNKTFWSNFFQLENIFLRNQSATQTSYHIYMSLHHDWLLCKNYVFFFIFSLHNDILVLCILILPNKKMFLFYCCWCFLFFCVLFAPVNNGKSFLLLWDN